MKVVTYIVLAAVAMTGLVSWIARRSVSSLLAKTAWLRFAVFVLTGLNRACQALSAGLSRQLAATGRKVENLERPEPQARQAWLDQISSQSAQLALVAQPLIFYYKVLFRPTAHIPYDIQGFHLPLAAYIGRCARERIFPFWEPYPYCGVPIHADLTAQLFYPFTWISILLGNFSDGHKLFYWIEWLVPLHMILAGLFAYLLLRELGVAQPFALYGATVYQLGGYFASQAQHLGAICCGAWMPLILLSVVRLKRNVNLRWVGVLALSTALSILAGFPAAFLAAFGAAGLLAFGLWLRGEGSRASDRWAVRAKVLSARANWVFFLALLSGFSLGVAITAVQLIPAYQLTNRSIASLRSTWYLTGGGLRLESLPSLFFPNFYHIFTPFDPLFHKLNIDFTFLYLYCGIITVPLVILAPFLRHVSYARMLFVLTVISAFWMLGNETPIYPLVFTHLPRMLRGALYAEFALLAFCIFASLTAAVAMRRVLSRAPRWLPWCIALLTASDLIYFGAGRPMNSMPGSYKESSEQEIAGLPGSLTRIHQLIDVVNPPLRIDYLETDPWPLSAEAAGMFRLPTPDGNHPLMLKRIRLLRQLFCSGNYWERDLPVNRPASSILRMLNVGYLVGHSERSRDLMNRSGLPLTAELSGWRFYRVPEPLPRFFLVERLSIVKNPDESFAYLGRTDFNPGEEAVVESQDIPSSLPLSTGTIQVQEYSPNRIQLRVLTAGPAFLASSEPLYPGWTASVNGKPAPLYMTNGAFRGMVLERGANQVVMTYWPDAFLVWVAVSAVSLLLAIVFIVRKPKLQLPARA